MKSALEIHDPETFARAFEVSRETMEALEVYEKLLRKWQCAVNLVAPATLNEIWSRHMADCAQLIDIETKSDSGKDKPVQSVNWLDLGSGGGFPGLVVAILQAHDPGTTFHLVESNGRKCAFLSEVVRRLQLRVSVHNRRIEDLELIERIGSVDVISARALARLPKLLVLSKPFVGRSTRCFYLKGGNIKAELREARADWSFTHALHPSRLHEDGCILEISKLQAL